MRKFSIFVPIDQGLATGTSDLLAVPGQLLDLRNAHFDRIGEVVKRTGSSPLPMGLQPPTVITYDESGNPVLPGVTVPVEPWKLATHQGSLLIIGKSTHPGVLRYSPAQRGWERSTSVTAPVPGASLRCNLSATAGVSTLQLPSQLDTPSAPDGGQYLVDAAISGPYAYLAATNGASSKVTEMCVELATGTVVWTNTVAAECCKVRVCSNQAVFIRSIGASIKVDRYPIGSTVPTTLTIDTTNAGDFFDLTVKSATQLSVLFQSNAGGLRWLDYSPVDDSAAVGVIVLESFSTFAWLEDLGHAGVRLVATSSNMEGVQVRMLASDGTVTHTYTADDGTITANVQGLIGHTTGVSGNWTLFIEIGTASDNPAERVIRYAERSGVTISNGPWFAGIGLVSKTWRVGESYYAVAAYGSSVDNSTPGLKTGQLSNFVIQLDTTEVARTTASLQVAPLARFSTWKAAGWMTATQARPTIPVVDSSYFYPHYVQSRFSTKGEGGISFDLAPCLSTIAFDPDCGPSVEAVDTTIIPSGGAVMAFDGMTLGDLGFHLFPDNVKATAGTTLTPPSDPMVEGDYRYVALYRYHDAHGRVYRSRPSASVSAHATTSVNSKIKIDVNTLRVTSQQDVFIEIYRTTQGPGLDYFLVNTVANDPTVNSVSLDDVIGDASLQLGELLYTSGGVLPNQYVPASNVATFWRNRLFLVSSENPRLIYYSKPVTPSQGFGFNEAQTIIVPGPVTGLGGLSDRLVIFTASEIYFVAGDGPDPAFQSGGFTQPQRIATGMGCDDVASIVVGPEGVMFRATDGGLFETNGAGLGYVGAAVQKWDDEPLVSAVMLPDLNHIRYVTSTGLVLNYDWIHKQWSVFDTYPTITSAVAWDGGLTYLTDTGAVYSPALIYGEAGMAYSQSITMPWIAAGGLGGWTALYRLQGQGEAMAPHTLQGDIWYDLDPSDIPSESRDLAVMDSGPWQWEWRPRRIKCSSAKVRVSEAPSFAAGFKMVGVTFEVALKQGLNRLPPSQRLR